MLDYIEACNVARNLAITESESIVIVQSDETYTVLTYEAWQWSDHISYVALFNSEGRQIFDIDDFWWL